MEGEEEEEDGDSSINKKTIFSFHFLPQDL